MEINDGMIWVGENIGTSILGIVFWWLILILALWIEAHDGTNAQLKNIENKIDIIITQTSHD